MRVRETGKGEKGYTLREGSREKWRGGKGRKKG